MNVIASTCDGLYVVGRSNPRLVDRFARIPFDGTRDDVKLLVLRNIN